MRLTIEINLDNAAFADNPMELDRVLGRVAARVPTEPEDGDGAPISDVNGNVVGHWLTEA